jgi:hypothetical protein
MSGTVIVQHQCVLSSAKLLIQYTFKRNIADNAQFSAQYLCRFTHTFTSEILPSAEFSDFMYHFEPM